MDRTPSTRLLRRTLNGRAGKVLLLLIILNEVRGLALVAGVLWAWRPWQ